MESPDQGIKYFNSIQGWRIESLDDQVMDSAPEDLPIESDNPPKDDDLTEDDLPLLVKLIQLLKSLLLQHFLTEI